MCAEVNTTELLATTIELYDKKLNKSFEQELMVFNLFKKLPHLKTNMKGRVFPIYTSPNPSINWRGESGAFPPGGTHKAKQMRVFYVRPAIARRLSGDSLDLTSEDSIIDAFSDGMDMDYETLMRDMNEEIFSDGTGLKAVVSSVSGSTITFALPLGVLRLLERGDYKVYNPSTGAARAGGTITIAEGGLTPAARTALFTVAINGAVVANDHIARPDSYLNSLTGLEKLVSNDTGDFQGVSRADVYTLRSPNLDAASRALSLTLIDQQELQVSVRAGKLKTGIEHIYVTHQSQLQAYRNLGRNYQEYQSGTKFDGGNGGIDNQTANGRKIWVDVCCKTSDWWMLNLQAFVYCEFTKLGLISPDGQKLRLTPGYDSSGVGAWLDSGVYMIGAKFDIGLLLPQTCSRMYSLDTTGLISPHDSY